MDSACPASPRGPSARLRSSQLGISGRAGTRASRYSILNWELPLLVPIARGLPGDGKFTAVKDLADGGRWAKSRRRAPASLAAWLDAAGLRRHRVSAGREAPIPVDLFVKVFANYERAETRAGRMDFDDLLAGTVDLLETDGAAVASVHARKRWISVDEYQDTNPMQERPLELWLGERSDVCVVGDEDQTIYTFTGATASS